MRDDVIIGTITFKALMKGVVGPEPRWVPFVSLLVLLLLLHDWQLFDKVTFFTPTEPKT